MHGFKVLHDLIVCTNNKHAHDTMHPLGFYVVYVYAQV